MNLAAILEDHNPWWREPAARRARGYTIRRDAFSRLLRHLEGEERRALLLLGPRQVGKTTLLLQVADELLTRGLPPLHLAYFDFLDDRITADLSPREVIEALPPLPRDDVPRVLLLDEVSKAERWDRWLKQAVDRGEGRILATDSVASALHSGGRESGQGRWDEVWIEGLAFREFLRFAAPDVPPEESARDRRLFEVYLAVGGFPEHVRNDDFPAVRERLRRDIVERALLRDLAPRVERIERLRDLFVYLMQESGDELVIAKRAADLEVDPRTVDSWLELLEETFLVMRLPAWTPSAKAKARLRPPKQKIYAADHGLVHAFAELGGPAAADRVRGRAFEAAAFRHLREWRREHGGELGFYRNQDGHELDFVWWRGTERVGVEVTSSRHVVPGKIAKVAAAAEQAGITKRLLLHDALTDGEEGPVRHVPLTDFLLNPSRFLEPTP
jgi:uncharacterized protein